ncbi:MAG: aldehyde dehydrogenase family protein [Novosphingobium sp.]|nr:aldehyde dehydrogenase family protein [Novosphingobium sp.]
MPASAETYAIPPSVDAFLAGDHNLLIGDRWTPATSGETLDIVNPATGKVIAKAAMAGVEDVDAAVRAARHAFDHGPWSKMMPAQRRALILALADEIEAHIEELAMIDTLNMGMPVPDARYFSVMLSIESLRYNAGWCGKISGETVTVGVPDHHAYTIKEPIGVVGAIVPWNTPLMAGVIKIAPALAAGCTVILKPAEITPLTAVRLGQMIEKVGFPPGVVNILAGHGGIAGQALVEHPGVDKISFTGSTAVGQHLVRTAAGTMKRISLELGGKSPVFIFPDADLELAIPMTAMLIFKNSGQICAAGSRLFAHHTIFDKVVAGIEDFARRFKVGSPLEMGVEMGPLVSEKQMNRVTGYIDKGRADGAEVACGGGRVGSEGFFVEPTVMVNARPDISLVREEIFGPVLVAAPVTSNDLDQVAAIGNDSDYGLSAYVWTNNMSVGHQMARKLKTGSVRINGGVNLDANLPFGGAKMSGWGREYGRDGVEAFFESKTVSVALTAGLGQSDASAIDLK